MKKVILLAMLLIGFSAMPALAAPMLFAPDNMTLEKVPGTLVYNASFTTNEGITVTMSANSDNGPTGWAHWSPHHTGVLSFQPDRNTNSYAMIEFSQAVDMGVWKLGLGRGNSLEFTFADGSTETFLIEYFHEWAGEVTYGNETFDYMELDLSQFTNVTSVKIFRGEDYPWDVNPNMFRPIELGYAPSAVPAPAAVLLLGSGLAGIIGLRRKIS